MCRRPIGLFFAAALIAAGACARSHHHEPSHLAVVSQESAPAVDVAAPEPPAVDFASQIRPILEQQCMPCHFEGGTMYASLPFDQPQTVHDLGTKLFARIKDEDDQELIRLFLASSSADEGWARKGDGSLFLGRPVTCGRTNGVRMNCSSPGAGGSGWYARLCPTPAQQTPSAAHRAVNPFLT